MPVSSLVIPAKSISNQELTKNAGPAARIPKKSFTELTFSCYVLPGWHRAASFTSGAQFGAKRRHRTGCVAPHGGCPDPGRRGDLGLGQVSEIPQNQYLTLADGKSSQRRDDGGARQGKAGLGGVTWPAGRAPGQLEPR